MGDHELDVNELNEMYPNMDEKSISFLVKIFDKNKDNKLELEELKAMLPTVEQVRQSLDNVNQALKDREAKIVEMQEKMEKEEKEELKEIEKLDAVNEESKANL